MIAQKLKDLDRQFSEVIPKANLTYYQILTAITPPVGLSFINSHVNLSFLNNMETLVDMYATDHTKMEVRIAYCFPIYITFGTKTENQYANIDENV